MIIGEQFLPDFPDAKETTRAKYSARRPAMQDHGTRGHEWLDRREARELRAYNRYYKEYVKFATERFQIAESMDGFVEPEEDSHDARFSEQVTTRIRQAGRLVLAPTIDEHPASEIDDLDGFSIRTRNL